MSLGLNSWKFLASPGACGHNDGRRWSGEVDIPPAWRDSAMRLNLPVFAVLVLSAAAPAARAQATMPYRRPVEPPGGSYVRVNLPFSGTQSLGRLGRVGVQLGRTVNVPD